METITSLSNPLIKRARALHQKKARTETGLFLVEGIHHIGQALEAGWQAEAIFYTPELLTSAYAHQLLAGLKLPPQPVSLPVIRSLADKENPQGIVAVIRQRQTALHALPHVGCALALLAPQDPGNVGTILRTMDAIQCNLLFLLEGGVELYHPTLVRASMGALFWKPVVQTSFPEFISWVRRSNFQLIGTSSKADQEYRTLHPRTPWALLLGSEQKGLSPQHLAACDSSVSLPMRGTVTSLNLAVAAGILLYQYAAE